MRFKWLLLGFTIVITVNACMQTKSTVVETEPPLRLEEFSWLNGSWKVGPYPVYETWKWQNGQWDGKSYMINDGDTSIGEYLQLKLVNDTIFYIPTVLNQNDGKSIPFSMSNMDYKSPIFVNPNHDFPQKIHYHYIQPDSIKVVLEGTPDKKTEFYLLRHE